MSSFQLTSPDIPADGSIAPVFESDMFGCGGANQSPVLQWSGAPEGTKSDGLGLVALDGDQYSRQRHRT